MEYLNLLLVVFAALLQTGLTQVDGEGKTEQCTAIPQIRLCQCTTINSTTIVEVDCTNVGFSNDDLLRAGDIPRTVQTLIVKNNNLRILDDYLLDECQDDPENVHNNLKTLDLSNDHIRGIGENAFKCMPNLETLILNDNNYSMEHHTSVFEPLKELKRLSMNNAFLVKDQNGGLPEDFLNELFYGGNDGDFTHDLLKLEELNLTHNYLHEVTTGALCDMKELKRLDLSHNLIKDIDAVVDCFEGEHEKLSEIYLHHNQISSPRFLDDQKSDISKWEKVNVAHNPFLCDCHILPFRNWLNAIRNKSESIIIDPDEIKCHLPIELRDQTIFEADIPACETESSLYQPNNSLAYILPIVAVTIIITMVILYTVGFDKCKKNPKIRRKMMEAGVFKNPTYESF